ncbi:MAG: arabinan endo,5-alpha-L-arabinosidase [Actinomycetota bacterium]|nr:arabinan endo,5-alpha-L-arabinosidase [Actinomycetota bacterium]
MRSRLRVQRTGALSRVLGALTALVVVTALGGCSGGSAQPSSAGRATDKPGGTFVIDRDFPDPDVMKSGGTYYAYATNTASVNVQQATSVDLASWKVSPTDALPHLPGWASKGNTWAPDVSELSPGHFIMYFVARDTKLGLQCIGVATSTSPSGPFTSNASAPITCHAAEGGAIDPSTFVDTDGARYLVWKNDGNCCGFDTYIQISRLSGDGLSLVGSTTKLFKQTEAWEGTLIEAPTLVKHGGNYVLFYSANDYGGYSYAIGYAHSTSLLGPYTKRNGPFLSSQQTNGLYIGPGGQDVVAGPDGRDRLIFHSWDPAIVYRGVNTLPLKWKNDLPVLEL